MKISDISERVIDFCNNNKIEISVALLSTAVYHLYQRLCQSKIEDKKERHLNKAN